ncbi:MAG: DUF695 domain-containing protein [Bacteroidota bacterium]
MKTKSVYTLLVTIVMLFNHSFAQNSTEHWDSYIATYDNGKPGSTTVRLDLIEGAPITAFPHVLVTGINYETSREDGFPENDTFALLHQVGDELERFVASETEYILVGSFMYDKQRLEYFYVKRPQGLEEKLNYFYEREFPGQEFYVNLKADSSWTYYREFIYPNDATLNYMSDLAVVRRLEEAGDPLTEARRVDHWLYFSSRNDMEKCSEEIKKLGFEIESSEERQGYALPFEMLINRKDKVDINSINAISSTLRELAIKYKGDYDGWETFVLTE